MLRISVRIARVSFSNRTTITVATAFISAPFLFRGNVCGAMVRLSISPIVNVTSGGGETGFFVIKDASF
jgi:hypothetical protein